MMFLACVLVGIVTGISSAVVTAVLVLVLHCSAALRESDGENGEEDENDLEVQRMLRDLRSRSH